MERNVSLVKTDVRHHRVIAKEHWGLSSEQMKGMHVHHRIPRSRGGTNDPSNLFVCSPSFHRYAWHGDDSFHPLIEAAHRGGLLGSQAFLKKVEEAKQKGIKWEPAQRRARRMHEKHRGSKEYSQAQKLKSFRGCAAKRQHWTQEEYDFVWSEFVKGPSSGYLIAKKLGKTKWRKYENMRELLSLGLSFDQVTNPDQYVEEKLRLAKSSVSHLIRAYDD